MRWQSSIFVLILATFLILESQARRIRVRPVQQEEEEEQDEEQVQYYESVPQDSQEQRVVYISAADQYNGLYGQPSASSRSSAQDNYIQSARGAISASKSRTKEAPKAPPVQTIRNYNKVNDDGSFTFGYEAADGSFKEETRGTDCVVRGKYGYVDPDGNKREFTYVSGNPCDPNAPKDEDQEPEQDRTREEDSNESDNVPNYPTRPIRPIRPIVTTPAPKPSVTLFQNNYVRDDEEEVEDDVPQVRPQQIQPVRSRPVYYQRPQYEAETEAPVQYRPRIYTTIPSTTPSSLIYKNTVTPLSITPRPTSRTEPATTYRPQPLQYITPKPSLLYTKPLSSYSTRPSFAVTTPASYTRGNLDFDAEFQKFQQENTIGASTPATNLPKAITKANLAPKPTQTPSVGNGQVYSSALVYDPKSGQYNTQLYQSLPQTEGDFTVSGKIQPYVYNPQPQIVNYQQLQAQSPLYRTQRPQSNQALYQQQQAEVQFQNSAQLYAQQQKARQQAQQSQQQQQQQQTAPQQFYYVQPQSGYTGGQIDAFLRGHNIQF